MSAQPQFTSRAPGRPWGHLIVLLVPFGVLGVWLKAVRIERFFPNAGLVEFLAKLSSDLAFGLFWGLFWAVLLLYVANRRLHTLIVVLAQVLTGLIGVLVVLNHAYTLRTGNPLTLAQIALAVEEADALSALISSQVDSSTVGLLIIVVVWTAGVPWLLGRWLSRLFRRPASVRIRRVGVISTVLMLLAATWTAPTASAAFSLAPAVQLAVTPIREASAYPEELASTDPLPDPTSTRLVRREARAQRNLVVITLESQRATSTLPETKAPVTPVLDALALQSTTPERGYTALPHTSKALVAVHCGMTPPPDKDNTEADENGLPQRCLPELLADEGYVTAFFQSATEHFERRRQTVANLGFDAFTSVDTMDKTGFNKANYFGYEDDIMLEPARNWLETVGEDPFLLSFLTVAGHHDYKLEGYEPIDFVDRALLNDYLNSIQIQDRFVGNVIEMFKELGLYEETVFVITGDHGEGFGEHRLYQHDNTIYEEGARIAMMVHDPQRAPGVVQGPVSQLALMPTALDALGYDIAGEVGYQPSLFSGEPQGPVVVSCWVRGRCTAVLDGDLKLIHHFGDRRDEVFDLATDNYELRDLATSADAGWMERSRELAVSWYLEAERWYQQ